MIMKKSDYDEAVYLANLINSGRVPDWSVSYDGVKLLAKALISADENINKQAEQWVKFVMHDEGRE